MADLEPKVKRKFRAANKEGERKPETKGTHRQRKKAPYNPPKSETDIYVTARSDFQGQLRKTLKLFEEGAREVVVHGLGRAVAQAANLSLQVEEKLSSTVQLSVSTDSVELQDEWEPILDEAAPFTSTRTNSALHIKISRIPEFPY